MGYLAAHDVVSGRYELIRPLGTGGMGTLWVAKHIDLERLVAIKFMAPEISAAEIARTRFWREAWAAARIRSPHVITVFDHGMYEEQPFLVMELLIGEDLAERLKRHPSLPLPTAANIALQAARGLARAHELGVVHRDLKPANLFLARTGEGKEIVKILDFGIAKSLVEGPAAGDPTAPGEILGSPEYMSPEQALGNPIDHRSDLWSLALVFYRMLAGRNAFEGHGISALLSMLTTGAPPLCGDVPGLPILVDRFFERALAKEASHRFQSAGELAEAIAMIAGLPAEDPEMRRTTSRPPLSGTDELPSLAMLARRSHSSAPPQSGMVERALEGEADEEQPVDDADVTRVDRRLGARVDGLLPSRSVEDEEATMVSGEPEFSPLPPGEGLGFREPVAPSSDPERAPRKSGNGG